MLQSNTLFRYLEPAAGGVSLNVATWGQDSKVTFILSAICAKNLIRLTLQRQNTEISKQIFPKKEYRGLSPNFHIHVPVSDLYIPMIGLPILLEELCRPILRLI